MRLRWQGKIGGKAAAFGASTDNLSPASPRSELLVTLTGILGSIVRDLQDQLSVAVCPFSHRSKKRLASTVHLRHLAAIRTSALSPTPSTVPPGMSGLELQQQLATD